MSDRVSRRKPLGGPSSLKRRTTPRAPEPIRPEDYATPDKPIGMCRACHHHTSAWIGGACTVLAPHPVLVLAECGCDCRKHLNGDPP